MPVNSTNTSKLNDIAKTLRVKPKLLERKKINPRVLEKLMEFIERFSDF